MSKVKRARRFRGLGNLGEEMEVERRPPPPVNPKNKTQAQYLDAMSSYSQVFVLGPAGTGKTWLAATRAADMMMKRQIDKIILTRPNVPSGRPLGFYPGNLVQKFSIWAAPLLSAIRERMGPAMLEFSLREGDIEMVPFEVMRGRSWRDAFIILDEAQNATPQEMKTFLTRIGEDCITVINGDVTQSDLDANSGLAHALRIIREQKLQVPVIEFNLDDIVRSGTCAMWVRAFHRDKS